MGIEEALGVGRQDCGIVVGEDPVGQTGAAKVGRPGSQAAVDGEFRGLVEQRIGLPEASGEPEMRRREIAGGTADSVSSAATAAAIITVGLFPVGSSVVSEHGGVDQHER